MRRTVFALLASVTVLHAFPASGGRVTPPSEPSGAGSQAHWSFAPPVEHVAPSVVRVDWPIVKHDAFVLARLEREELSPAPQEERRRFIRRLTLDLTGLPPTREEVDAFERDDDPRSVQHAVDRLLATEAFGERFARVWLDLFRHADTRGYEKDLRRSIWPFRDWLIRALNDDRSLPQLTEAMLAGDLLEAPSESDRIATAMHRNTMANDEGGTDDEEYRVAAVKDRTDVTLQVWMGLTVGCAKCHSHKYDPISQTEYYRLMAFFDQTEDADHADDAPTLTWLSPEQIRTNQSIADEKARIPGVAVPVMRELPPESRRVTRVHLRGSFLSPGAVVTPDVPEFLPRMPASEPRNRLGLAHWLTARENPLTARVLVNRYFAQFFGSGIVETEEDFGTQGTPPPDAIAQQMLDDLAVRFMNSGWSLKWLCREIATSATYRQAARWTPEVANRDPRNRLFSHGPRVRLDAEMVRDQALAVSGLLSRKMYGPPVMPRQPDGIWAVVYSDDKWVTSEGEDRFRRSVYTFVRRTSAYPTLLTFDAPTRETCTVRRIATNTPLQALVTLNDPVFVECAQALARRAVREVGAQASVAEIAERLFSLAVLRPPLPRESEVLLRLYQARVSNYREDSSAAHAMAQEPLGAVPAQDGAADVASLAAWTNVANVVLNLDEVLNR